MNCADTNVLRRTRATMIMRCWNGKQDVRSALVPTKRVIDSGVSLILGSGHAAFPPIETSLRNRVAWTRAVPPEGQRSTSQTTTCPLSPPAAARVPSGENAMLLMRPMFQVNVRATSQVVVS